MRKLLAVAVSVFFIGGLPHAMAQTNGNGVGNPWPGVPHDTVIIHVTKADTAERTCDGGHALFLRHYGGVVPATYIYITMIDWEGSNADNDLLYEEDPIDGVDNDNDGSVDEDPPVPHPGKETKAIDCDAKGDNKVSLQIRDTRPERGIISTQNWWMRLIGKPEQNFTFTSYANQTVTCTFVENDPGTTEDDTAICTTGESNNTADWIELASFNLASEADGECVKQVKPNARGGGGRTPFCDVTKGFLVDVDTNGDDIPEEENAFVFGIRVGCVDDLATPTVDESQFCPLSGIVWETGDGTTSQAKVQIFVSHTGAAYVRNGRILRNP